MLSPLSCFLAERQRIDPHNPVDEWHVVREPGGTVYVLSGELLRACAASPLPPRLATGLLDAVREHRTKGATLALGLHDAPEFPEEVGQHRWTTGLYRYVRVAPSRLEFDLR